MLNPKVGGITMGSYKAIITPITNIREHPNADNLNLGTAAGMQILVSKDTVEGTLGIFFPYGGQISEEFAINNKLLRKDPITGEEWPGYLDLNRRVRILKMRGTYSEGIWMELDKLSYAGDISKLKAGMTLEEFNGHHICNKYITQRMRSLANKQKKSKKSTQIKNFFEIGHTNQLRDVLTTIPKGAVMHISRKLHGTSGRTGLHRIEVQGFWKSLWRLLKKKPMYDWVKVSGTRRTVFDPSNPEHFRTKAHNLIIPRKGETWYYEIVGYKCLGKPIMKTYNPGSNGIAAKIKKQYGNNIIFSYGLENGQSDIYVYKITQVNEDGDVVTLSPAQTKARTESCGLKFVPEVETKIFDGDIEALVEYCNIIAECPSVLDPSHPCEGLVFRIDHCDCSGVYKWKSRSFSVLEQIKYSDPDYVDPEDFE